MASKTNEDVIDASVNTCCKLKLVFSEKRLLFSDRQYFEMESLYQTESFLTACISLVHEPDKSIAIMYELTKRSQEMLFADWAQ